MRAARFDETEIRALRAFVLARTGLNFPESRLRDLEDGLHRAMLNAGSVDFEHFVGLLDTDQRVFDTLIGDITVAETYFFREPAQFQVLRQLVLPDLRNGRAPGDRLRVWSAGCATGEEPYSLAILLEQEGLAGQASILATDISRAALARARDASYGSWSLRNSIGDGVMRCFDRRGDRFVLQERFHSRVEFRYLNLASSAYPAPKNGVADIDLILCRNVLIYFDAETVQRVARQLFESLRQGGWLITGPSDPPLWDFAPYRTIVTAAGVFYQRSEKAETVHKPVAPAVIWPQQPERHVIATPPVVEIPQAAPPPASDARGPSDCATWIARVRKRVDRGPSEQAVAEAVAALDAYPLCPELHYLHAIALIELEQPTEAAAALRRIIYLDPGLAIVHFTLGSVLLRLGAGAEAQRSYQNALELCHGRPEDEILPLSDNEPVGRLIEAARSQIGLMDKAKRAVR